MVWSVWLLISKKWTQSTTLSGLMELSTAKFSLILSMNIPSTALRSAIKTCSWGILRGLKQKLSAVWTSIWCTQPMTMFSNAHIPLTSWMHVELYL